MLQYNQKEGKTKPKRKGEKKMNHVIYVDRLFVDGKEVMREQKSKVYGVYLVRYPSGVKEMVKVWNTRVNKMVSVRRDSEIVAVVD